MALVAGLPQARQAGGSTAFPGLGLLVAGKSEGLLAAGFRLGRIRVGLVQQQCPLAALRLSRLVRFVPVLAMDPSRRAHGPLYQPRGDVQKSKADVRSSSAASSR
jgi:hypothetical protein